MTIRSWIIVGWLLWAGAAVAGDLNPAAVAFKLPDQIPWKSNPENPGVQNAVLAGDPSKPGLYVVMTKWLAGHMSHPHFHPNDRFITVLSGTWWVGSGTKFDPDNTVPMPAGTFVTHFGQQVHYDGAKEGQGDAVLLIVGEGPATATPAEVK
ncbi:MAG: cupin domain-containing protein [Alphaproteobacteria bacterium]|nr:cupin domain-containing protein [Alphaproteobacteria bacterium]